MKYALVYFKPSKHLQDFNEIILDYNHKTADIVSHVQDNYKQEQRIILNIQQLPEEDFEESIVYMRAAAQAHPEIAVMGTVKQLPRLKESGLSYFFAEIADSWDKLNGFINMGVSDVYVGNEFAFNMEKISDVCKNKNVAIRVFANVAQTSCSAVGNDMTHFFIRPEDVMTYNDLIDVIEFFGPKDRQDVLYQIYTQGKWIGNLNELIIGLNQDINNTLITEIFGVLRRSCGKRCSYADNCNLCNRFPRFQQILIEGGNNASELT